MRLHPCRRAYCCGSLVLDEYRELVCTLCARRTVLVTREERIAAWVALYFSDPLEIAAPRGKL